ncbi:MAG: hypothetical protein ACFFE4_15630 [Candidatus Thorarchaeota archaeon]
MGKDTTIEIKCHYCEKWFKSSLRFDGLKSYDVFPNQPVNRLIKSIRSILLSAKLNGRRVICPYCNRIIKSNKENIRFIERNRNTGEVHYIEGKDLL